MKYKSILVPKEDCAINKRSKIVHFTRGYSETYCYKLVDDKKYVPLEGNGEIGVNCQRCIRNMHGY